MSEIKSIEVREILDSRAAATIEVGLYTSEGLFFASVPSGISKGKYEAKAKPAKEAIKNLKEIIAPALKGKDASQQKEIDGLLIGLDGTEDKSRLGANTILAVSMACCRAGAAGQNLSLYQYISHLCGGPTSASFAEVCPPLPLPCLNIIEGGRHAPNDLDVQEFMIVPQFGSFAKNFQAGKEIYLALKEILEKKFGKPGIELGDEGGFAPPISRSREALDFLMQALKRANCLGETKIGLDCAASQFQCTENSSRYILEGEEVARKELLDFYLSLIKAYPIIFLEDPFSPEDWRGWQKISAEARPPQALRRSGLRNKILNLLIVADDLTATNPGRIKLAHQKNACNGLVIKPNQIGTVTETLEAAKLAKEFDPIRGRASNGAGWKIIVSHRSGETNDDFIADLAVGLGADFIKSGAPAQPERLSKYERLLKIEQEIKK